MIQRRHGRAAFPTSSGKRVVTTNSALVDYQVWMLHGASQLLILWSKGDNMFGFESEAIVVKEAGSVSDVMFDMLIDTLKMVYHRFGFST
jgi:hypothetical protein